MKVQRARRSVVIVKLGIRWVGWSSLNATSFNLRRIPVHTVRGLNGRSGTVWTGAERRKSLEIK